MKNKPVVKPTIGKFDHLKLFVVNYQKDSQILSNSSAGMGINEINGHEGYTQTGIFNKLAKTLLYRYRWGANTTCPKSEP